MKTKGIFGLGTLGLLAAVLAIGGAVWFIGSGDAGPSAEGAAKTLRSRKIAERKAQREARAEKRRKDREKKKSGKVTVAHLNVKPDFLSSTNELAALTAEMKKMFLDLQAALDLDDRKKVYQLVHKLQLMDEWPDGIPKSVKLKALDALAWFGAPGLAEAIGFLADSDATIRQTAVEKFEQMFADNWSMGDIKLAETLTQAVKVVSDVDALDSFYDQFMNMRDTVKAETALKILGGENAVAAKELEGKLGDIFEADYEVKTREDVERFLKDAQKAYKDDPQRAKDDEEMYGPSDWDW